MNNKFPDLDEIHERRARSAESILARRVPVDIEEANTKFGANCGPAALAAALGVNVLEIMEAFPHFPKRTYTNSADMKRALKHEDRLFEVEEGALPKKGLALIQFTGPWSHTASGSSSALKRTHWIAVDGDLVFDLNWGTWMPLQTWEFGILPMFQSVDPEIESWEPRLSYALED